MAALAKARFAQHPHDRPAVRGPDLQHGAELLAEERREREILRPPGELLLGVALERIYIFERRIESEGVEVERHAAVPGESHLACRHEQAPVGAVVVGEQMGPQFLDRREEGFDELRVGVGRLVAELREHLRKNGAAEPVSPLAEVDEDELAVAAVGA
jgi:hypothetical protein